MQVLDGVVHSVRGQAAVAWTGAAQYSIAEDGSLFYAPGAIEPPLLSSLVWADRQGTVTPVAGMRPMFRFGARVYARYQPQFLDEFIEENMNPATSSADYVTSQEMVMAAHEARGLLK